MAIARVGAHDLFYEIDDEGREQAGRLPVVLLMGLGTDSNAWERQVPVLARSRRVLVLDNRGVGRSAKPRGPYTTAELAADALGVMDAAGLDVAHVVGVSLGGAIAQEIVLGHPERVRSVALLATFAALDATMRRTADQGTAASVRSGLDVGAAMRGLAEGHVELDPQALIGFLMPLVFSRAFLEKERDYLKSLWSRALSYGVSSAGFAGQVAAALAHDARARLPSVRTPTLVVTGDKDRLVPPAQSRILAEAIPGARLVEIAGGTHGLTLERADELNELLESWLAENDA